MPDSLVLHKDLPLTLLKEVFDTHQKLVRPFDSLLKQKDDHIEQYYLFEKNHFIATSTLCASMDFSKTRVQLTITPATDGYIHTQKAQELFEKASRLFA
jgi:hypothetical protein